MSDYLALVEVDQRQNFILRADKLREMLGASQLIGETIPIAKGSLNHGVKLIWGVSGVLWLTSEELFPLKETLGKIRREFRVRGLSATFAIGDYTDSSLDSALKELQKRMRILKNAKSGEDASPRSPFFAQCSIQGQLSANQWWPERPQTRRRLISDDSAVRLREGDEYRRNKHIAELQKKYKGKLEDFDDLVLSDSSSDSYISLCKADVDALGRLLLKVNWADLAEALTGSPDGVPCSPEEAADRFSHALCTVIEGAVWPTIEKLVARDRNAGDHKKDTCLPILPLVVAGDDIWILCRRDMAFPLAVHLSRYFEETAAKNEVLQTAIRLFQPQEPLSLSFGLLFAKKGFPFDAQLELAEELERGAKTYRRELELKSGCIDYHWLESSGRETIERAREAGYSIPDANDTFWLITRPWTVRDGEKMLEAAHLMLKIPRRKRHQLDTILRYGAQLSDLAYVRWLRGLTGNERNGFNSVLAAIPEHLRPADGGPWFFDRGKPCYKSCLAELAQLAEVVARPGEDDAV